MSVLQSQYLLLVSIPFLFRPKGDKSKVESMCLWCLHISLLLMFGVLLCIICLSLTFLLPFCEHPGLHFCLCKVAKQVHDCSMCALAQLDPGKPQACLHLLTELRFGCSLLESQYSRDKCWYVALFRKLTTWGEGGLVSKNQLWRFCLTMKVFKGRIIWRGAQNLYYLPLCADFLLIGWSNGVVFQVSCVQPEVTILHLGGDFSSCRKTQRYCLYPLRRSQDPALITALLVLDCSSFVSAFPLFPV